LLCFFRFTTFVLCRLNFFASFRFISFSFCMWNLLFHFKAKQVTQNPLFCFEAKRISLLFCLVSLRNKKNGAPSCCYLVYKDWHGFHRCCLGSVTFKHPPFCLWVCVLVYRRAGPFSN
jgi:hypothetical protein